MTKERQLELEQAIAYGNKDIDTYLELSDMYFFHGFFDKALSMLKECRQLMLSSIDKAQILQLEAEIFFSLARFDEGLENYRQSICSLNSTKQTSDYFLLVGRAYYTLSLYMADQNEITNYSNKAIEYLTKSLAHEMQASYLINKKALIYSWIGDMHSKNGEFNESLKWHNKALEIATNREDIVSILLDIACLCGKMGNFTDSENVFKKAIAEARFVVPLTKVYYEMGKMYIQWQKLPKARDAFVESLKCLESDVRLKLSGGYEAPIFWYIGFTSYEIAADEPTIR